MRNGMTRFSTPTTSTTSKFPRALCLATAGMAFLLGAVVGVLLPFYVFVPALDASSNSSTSAKVIPTYVHTSQNQWRRPDPSRQSSSSKRDVTPFSVIKTDLNANNPNLTLSNVESSPKQFNFDKVQKVTIAGSALRRRKSKLASVSGSLSTSSYNDNDSHASAVNEIGQVLPNKGHRAPDDRPIRLLPNWLARSFHERGSSSGSSSASSNSGADRQQIDDQVSPFGNPSRPISAAVGSVRVISSPPSLKVFASGAYTDRPDERRLPTESEPSHVTSPESAAAAVPSPVENPSWKQVKDEGSVTTPLVTAFTTADGVAASLPSSPLPLVIGNVEGFEGKVVDGIFWTSAMDQMVPNGFSPQDDQAWREFVNSSLVLKIEEGCGRMQNRILTFDGGNESCCRYRQNNDQIQGEIFSFYLSRILGIGNLPPAVLGIVRGKEWQWDNVWSQLHLAQWNSEKPVVLTKFVPDLKPSLIPPAFQDSNRRLHPIPEDLNGKNKTELIELVQWSDLIVFDYLTGNLDRVVNNMFNQQWNAAMMRSPAHNLAQSSKTGLLVFLDNESGLLHGYRLLDKYDHFHKALLDSLCIFRKRTADAISKLYRNANIGQLLRQHFRQSDPGMDEWLPFIPDRHLKTLSERIGDVYRRIRICQAQYGPLLSS